MKGLITVESKIIKKPTPDYDLLFAEWIKFAQVKPTSVAGYTKGVKNFFAFARANGISEITRDVLLSYRAYLAPITDEEAAQGKKAVAGVRAGFKAATANLYLTATKLFVTFLYQKGIIPANVSERIKNFKVSEEHSKDPLEPDTVKKIIASIETETLSGKRDVALFATMVSCGLRCVEISRANIRDIVPRGTKNFLYVQGKGRDDKAQCVELPAGVYKLIRSYLDTRGDVSKNAPLFASTSHRNSEERITTNSISRLIKGILRKNKLDSERLTAHSLRHTCATVMINNGVELRRVKDVLRHKSVVVTERYLKDIDRYNNGGECKAAEQFGL